MRAELLPPKKHVIRWEESEWSDLAEKVHSLRAKHPELGVIELARRVQEQWPEHRRRTLATCGQLEELLRRLRARDQELIETAAEVMQLRDRCDTLSQRPNPIDQLTTEQIVERFSDIVLQHLPPCELLAAVTTEESLACIATPELVGYAAKRLSADLLDVRQVQPIVIERPAPVPVKTNGHTAKRPRIAFIGPKPDQATKIREQIGELADLHFVAKSRQDADAIPKSIDHVLLWANFSSHAIQTIARNQVGAERLTVHHGGMTQLVAKAIGIIERESLAGLFRS